jgi:hypothetical protein
VEAVQNGLYNQVYALKEDHSSLVTEHRRVLDCLQVIYYVYSSFSIALHLFSFVYFTYFSALCK